MVNFTIGAGIFGLPSSAAGLLGKQSPIAYLITALGIGVIAACVAEVASRFQQTGGPYLYAQKAFGSFLGLQTGWLLWLTRVTSAAAVANIFVDYLLGFWSRDSGPIIRFLILTIVVGGLALINIRGISFGTKINNIFTVAKLLPLLILVVAGLVYLGLHGRQFPGGPESHPIGDWLSTVLLLVYAFTGFESALIPSGEIKNPRRDVAKSVLISLLLVTGVYFFLQVIVVYLLPKAAAQDRPLSAAAYVVGGNGIAVIVLLGALLSSFGSLTANMTSTPRLTFAFAEQGYFPRWFCAVHRRYRTPYNSIIVFAILLWVLALMGTFRWNAALSAISRLFVYGITCAALPVLRTKRPGAGFQLTGGLVLAVLGVLFVLVLVSQIGRTELIVLAATGALALLNGLAVRPKT
jgi:basic amino acid/polyamine antiporter, APA family